MNRNEWLAFLRSNDSEAKELLALHPGMKPPDESTWREALKDRGRTRGSGLGMRRRSGRP